MRLKKRTANKHLILEWQHIAISKIDSKVKLYYNGDVVDQLNLTNPITTSTVSLYIGTYHWGYTSGVPVTFNGKLDDFGLNEKEIEFNMDN